MTKFFQRITHTQAYDSLLEDSRNKKFIAAFGVQPTEKPFIAANADGFSLYVTSDYVEAQRVLRTISALRQEVVYLPSKEDVLLYKRENSKNSVYMRNYALYRMLTGATAAVVTAEALMQYLPEKHKFLSDCFTLQKGNNYDRSTLLKSLVECGYTRVDGISAEGEFVLRGDILDISMPFGKRYRADFFDDVLEDIKGEGDKIDIYPLYETTGLAAEKLSEVHKLADRQKVSPDAHARLSEIISELSLCAHRADNAWLIPFVPTSVIFQYLPQNTTVFWDEPKLLWERTEFLYREHAQRVANLTQAGEILPLHFTALAPKESIFNGDFPQIALQTLPYEAAFFHPQAIHNFCTPNALLTLKEYLDNYAAPATVAIGEKLLRDEMAQLPAPRRLYLQKRMDMLKEGKVVFF